EQGQDEAWAKATAAEMRKKSPTSLKVAFAQMRRGKTLSLAEALRLEFRLASQLIARPDYREGIASRIVGKGTEPRWSPATLAEVDDAEIERLFATAPERELLLETRSCDKRYLQIIET
ncbi:MAG: enoyl-CoA hydratase/isomerase family protein, partial [Methyloceanibacter sp.]